MMKRAIDDHDGFRMQKWCKAWLVFFSPSLDNLPSPSDLQTCTTLCQYKCSTSVNVVLHTSTVVLNNNNNNNNNLPSPSDLQTYTTLCQLHNTLPVLM